MERGRTLTPQHRWLLNFIPCRDKVCKGDEGRKMRKEEMGKMRTIQPHHDEGGVSKVCRELE